jgi:Low molecular weight phosphotyrosine protein phosphatase
VLAANLMFDLDAVSVSGQHRSGSGHLLGEVVATLGLVLVLFMTTADVTQRPRILYACQANGGRSVISKVLTEHYGNDAVEVFSAGSEPGDRIHPEVAQSLTSLGLNVNGEVSTGFDTTATYDVVITQG